MTLTLVTGRANSGKTGEIHRRLEDSVRSRTPAVLLLPAAADAHDARVEIADRVPLGVRASTLDQWALECWVRTGDGRRIVPASVRAVIASRCVADLDAPLSHLSGSKAMRGLLCDLVKRTAGTSLPRGSTPAEWSLLRACSRYREAIDALEMVEAGEVYRSVHSIAATTICVNRFTDLSDAQRHLLTNLAVDNDVIVALPWERARPSTEALDRTVQALLAEGAAHVHLAPPRGDSELLELEESLFSLSEPRSPRGRVVLAEAHGAEAEAALAADLVGGLMDDGIAPGQVAVVFRNLADRKGLLEAAFADREIDFSIDVSRPFRETPLGRSLSGIVEVCAGRAGREILAGFLLGAHSGVGHDAVAEVDAGWRRNRTVAPGVLLDEASALSPATRTAVTLARKVASARTVSEAPWGGLAAVLLKNASDEKERTAADIALDHSAQALLGRAVADLEGLTGDVDAITFLEALLDMGVATGTAGSDSAVSVTEVHRLRSRRFDAVVIGGLTADEFSPERPEPAAVSLFRRLGVEAGTEQRLSERLLFYSVATRARERLVLLRQSADAQGQPVRTSAFWDDVLDVYRTADEARAGEQGALKTTSRLSLSELDIAAPAFTPARRAVRQRALGGEMRRPSRGRDVLDEPSVEYGAELSVTELETYHACPYRWFFERAVRPRAIDREFDARERGSWAHALLRDFYSRWSDPAPRRVTIDSLGQAMELLSGLTEEARRSVRTQGFAEEAALATAELWIQAAVQQDAAVLDGFVPSHFEWGFGMSAGREATFGDVPVRGTIDRIDVSESAVAVTDYKSSPDVKGVGSTATYGLFQILVYGEVAASALGKDLASGMYRALPSGSMRGYWNGSVRDPEKWVAANDRNQETLAEARAWAIEAVAEAADGIYAGRIEPSPRRADTCNWCGVRAVCGGRS